MILAAPIALLLLATAAAQPPLPRNLVNPGFEAPGPDDSLYGAQALPGWSVHRARGYRAHVQTPVAWSSLRAPEGRAWLSMGYFARSGPDRGSWIGVSQSIDARRWRGRRVRVSVAAKPAHFAAHRAWLNVSAGDAQARRGFDQVERWERYSVELDVPAGAAQLTIEIGADGDVEIDDIRIEAAR